MRRVEYCVTPGTDGWRVLANGVDCGLSADREVALVSAIRWARRGQRPGDLVTVMTAESGMHRMEWQTGDPFPPLRFLAALMRRPSSCFVREWADWRRELYISI